jgi:CCR4-NOT transcription complex subunit 1
MVPEQVIQMIVQDNLDVACATIEKAATDRATAELEEALATAWEIRRRHIREVRRMIL